jgi:hypothetical protein
MEQRGSPWAAPWLHHGKRRPEAACGKQPAGPTGPAAAGNDAPTVPLHAPKAHRFPSLPVARKFATCTPGP